MTDLSGRTIGDFDVVEPIGEGGFAVVYLARQRSLNRDVALKVLDPALARSEDSARRFKREGRAAASLEHPNIVPVYAAGEEDGVVYLAMRLIRGGTLEQLLDERDRLDPARTVEVIDPVAEALGMAHANGLIHRDVKPANIMLEDRKTYLTDFGIAVASYRAGQYTSGGIGTAKYMAPEQAQGLASVGPPADLYSLACTVFHCLIGTEPFTRATDLASILAHMNDPVPPTGMPALDSFLQRAMHKDPAVRHQDAAEFMAGLRRALGGDSGDPRRLPAISLHPHGEARPESGRTPAPPPATSPAAADAPSASSGVPAFPPGGPGGPFGGQAPGAARTDRSSSGRTLLLVAVPLALLVAAVVGFLTLGGEDDAPVTAGSASAGEPSTDAGAAASPTPADAGSDPDVQPSDADTPQAAAPKPSATDPTAELEDATEPASGGGLAPATEAPGDAGVLGGPADGDIAFVRALAEDDLSSFELFLVPDDGSPARQLTDDGVLDGSPIWLDADTILFPRGRAGTDLGLHTLDVRTPGAQPVRLTDGPFDADPALSPDGAQVVYSGFGPRGELDLFLLDLASLQTRRVGGTGADDLRAAFRPGGDTISFHTRVGPSVDVLEMDLASGESTPLIATPDRDEGRGWWQSRDVLFYESDEEVWRWEDGVANPFPLPDASASQPQVSPSGEYLLYRTFRDGVSTLVIQGFEGSSQTIQPGVPAQDGGWGPAP